MKKSVLLMFVAVMGLSRGTSWARPLMFAQLETYFDGNMNENLDRPSRDSHDLIGAAGGFRYASTIERKASGGSGGRIGLLFPINDDGTFRIGGSLGYLSGFKAKTVTSDTESFFPSPGSANRGKIGFEMENTYVRLLLEASKKFRFSKIASFKLGGGIGAARAHTDQTFTGEGVWAGVGTVTEHRIGFTWELAPSFTFDVGKTELELGFRYVHMPDINETAETYEAKYSGLGFFTGIAF